MPTKRPRRKPRNDFRISYRPMRQRRRFLDVTQKQLAEVVGCHWMTIWRIEAGRTSPSDRLLTAISRELGTPQSQLREVLPLESAADGRP